MNRSLASHPVMLTLVVALAALYLGLRADRGWIPHDEGLLAGAAERVLEGQLPHRDFDDAYTGGLAFLHALAFRLFGVNLLALRLVLLPFALLFAAALYRIAARFASPLTAAAVTLLAVAWSLPNYFAGMPSWYNLFFATFGILALLKYLEGRNPTWLLAAGLCAGLSVAVKITGLYFAAAVLLFLIYHEQVETETWRSSGRSWSYSLFVWSGLALFAAVVAVVFTRRGEAVDLFYFVLPGLVPAVFLAAHELRLERRPPSRDRFARLGATIGLFAAGAAVPVAVFLIPYVASGALDELWAGLFLAPQKRLTFNSIAPPSLAASWALLPLGGLLFFTSRRRWRRAEWWIVAPLAALGAALLAFAGRTPVYLGIWGTVRPLAALIALLGCACLARASGLAAERRRRLFLLVTTSALLGLVQYPNAPGIYFCYAAPILVLALAHLARVTPSAPRKVLACLLVFYFLFAAVWLNRGSVRHHGLGFTPVQHDTEMMLERGGLEISKIMAIFYHHLVSVVQAHSEDGAYIYAAPDIPEVYFLSARKNPTRTFYDFLDPDFGVDPEGRTRRILRALEEHDVDVLVLNWAPEFSLGVQRDLRDAIAERYPGLMELDLYTIHWREPVGGS